MWDEDSSERTTYYQNTAQSVHRGKERTWGILYCLFSKAKIWKHVNNFDITLNNTCTCIRNNLSPSSIQLWSAKSLAYSNPLDHFVFFKINHSNSTTQQHNTTMSTSSEHTARNRLATLAAHLHPSSAAADVAAAAILHPLRLSSSAVIAPPPNVKGTLTIVDERTGKKYQIQVSAEGTVRASDFKKVTLMITNFPRLSISQSGFSSILILGLVPLFIIIF